MIILYYLYFNLTTYTELRALTLIGGYQVEVPPGWVAEREGQPPLDEDIHIDERKP